MGKRQSGRTEWQNSGCKILEPVQGFDQGFRQGAKRTYLHVGIAGCTVTSRYEPVRAQDGHDQLQRARFEAQLDLHPATDTVLLR